jgi:membrane-bound lytic murein transglycosylase B
MRYLKILILASFALLSDLNLSAQANAQIASMNPILNDVTRSVQPTTVRTSQVTNLSQGRSLRPEIRRIKEQAAPQKEIILVQVSTTKDNASFTYWLRSFKARARSKGISQHIIEKAFDGVRYEAKTIKSDRNQAEFVKTIWDYLDSAVSSPRIAGGKVALHKHRTTFDAVEAKYGVEREVIAAIWGLESTYGELRGNKNIIEALATLAFDGRRSQFFEQQLLAALEILDNGDVSPHNMTGSWAGAMGHTQFIPTSYLAYAVDFTGDGKRDIWSDDPTDALASTAAYLKRFGWITGMPWGVEVQLPPSFNYALASRRIKKTPSDWGALGVRDTSGGVVHDYGPAAIWLPAGARGAAFMIFKNFNVIERYNAADAYVLSVGHLGDRLSGNDPIQASWPRGERALKLVERRELQELLTATGFSTQGVDGIVGPNTIDAIRAYQKSTGKIPDGYPSFSVLKALR